ncbi:MAG: TPM domain-containing protein [Cytophagales bacterium]|nr:TPM domain-containing protein [Cytophagales bacterium]
MFFSEAEKEQIVGAIKRAELNTSGEIKVHVEEHCPLDNPLDRAAEVFDLLSLDNTAQRNGVLFYLSIRDRQFAILGDKGIHAKVGQELWEEEKKLLIGYLSAGETVNGLCLAIEKAGKALQTNFPYQSDDVNEISDEISFGK